MLTRLGDEKGNMQSTEQPTVVITQQGSAKTTSGKLTKKHVLIAVVSLIIVGLAVITVLVGIHLVMKGNEETLKLSLSLKNPGTSDAQQNISTDAYANIVITHLVKDGLEVTINDDFDKDLQVMKFKSSAGVGCYVTPLNRSQTFNPKDYPTLSNYTAPNQNVLINVSATTVVKLTYDIAPTPINDTTFLGKRANALCANIPIYWLKPTCTQAVVEQAVQPVPTTTAVGEHQRSKRAFECSLKLKWCTKVVTVLFFKTTVSYPCGLHVSCCTSLKCLWADAVCLGCLGAAVFTSGVSLPACIPACIK